VRNLDRIFGCELRRSSLNHFKYTAAEFYSVTRQRILERIMWVNSFMLMKTSANIKGHRAYVWVLTNLRDVVYILAETREGQFVSQLLEGFHGVLVSDFYAAYDGIDCETTEMFDSPDARSKR
jgi:hypothetical protein